MKGLSRSPRRMIPVDRPPKRNCRNVKVMGMGTRAWICKSMNAGPYEPDEEEEEERPKSVCMPLLELLADHHLSAPIPCTRLKKTLMTCCCLSTALAFFSLCCSATFSLSLTQFSKKRVCRANELLFLSEDQSARSCVFRFFLLRLVSSALIRHYHAAA